MTVQDTVIGGSDSSGHHGRGGVTVQDTMGGGVTVQDTMGGGSDSSGHHGRGGG